jgi:hypothetical protein
MTEKNVLILHGKSAIENAVKAAFGGSRFAPLTTSFS